MPNGKWLITEKPAILILLVFFCLLLILVSPNGYNTIQAAPKTFFEGLVICLVGLFLLVTSRNIYLKYLKHDWLLLAPPFAFGLLGIFGHSNTLAAVIHPILIFFVAFSGVILLRSTQQDIRSLMLLVTSVAVSLCGIFWLIYPNYTDSFISTVSSIDRWGFKSVDPLRYPLLVINPFAGFAQKNIFSVLLATSVLTIAFMVFAQGAILRSKSIQFTTTAILGFLAFIVGIAGSLTAALGLIVGSALLFVHFWKAPKTIQINILCIPIGLAVGIWGPFDGPGHASAFDKIVNPSGSTDCRILWLFFNLEQFLAKPLFGSGLDSFSGEFMIYGSQTTGIFDVCNATPGHSHNAVAMFMGESGIFGLTFIVFPLILWLFLSSLGTKFFAISGLLSPIGLHSQTEWPLNASMLTWWFLILIPVVLSSRPHRIITKKTSTKVFLLFNLTLASAYLVSTLAANRGVSIERYLIERSPGPKQIELLLTSDYRLHPAFKPVYDIAINRALIDIAMSMQDIETLKRAVREYRRSIGPMAGHSEIQRLKRAELMIYQTQSHL